MNLIGVQDGSGSVDMQNVFGMVIINRLITNSETNALRIK